MLATSDIAIMRGIAESSMLDEAVVLTRTAGDWSRPGNDSVSASAPCVAGLRMTATKETTDGNQVAVSDAEIRLPAGTVVTNHDRIQINERHGEALIEPLLFAVVGVDAGRTATVVRALQITGNNAR
jgi:hypothetical protein